MKNILDKIMIFWAKFMKNHSSFMIKTESEYDKILKKRKKIVIIFWHPLCKPCQDIMLRLPYFLYKSFRKKQTLKFCNIKENKDIYKNLFIKKTPTLIYYESWHERQRLENEKYIFDFLS